MKSIIDEMVAEIRAREMNVFSVTEILNGESRSVTIKEDTFCRNVYSVSKAFTMAAIGFLFDEGKIKPSDTVEDIFKKLPEGADERWYEVTVHDLLRHRTGLTESMDVDCAQTLEKAKDGWLEYIFRLRLNGIRGETCQYTDAVFYLLSRAVSALTGKTLCDYLREKLFLPLNFREFAWSSCPHGYSSGGSGLYISCQDMAKLGKLWLGGGVYNGKRLLSEEWVRAAVENDYAFSLRDEKYKGYYKTGAMGQILYFSPPRPRA